MESNVTLGNIIQFGNYDWRVLDIQIDKILIITKNIIANRAYHNKETSITWEQCDLRNKYLKTEFYNSFNTEEKNQIIAETIENKDNQRYNTPGGNPTKDSVFLLSLDEVVRYFGDGSSIKYLENNDNQTQWIDDKNNSSRIPLRGYGCVRLVIMIFRLCISMLAVVLLWVATGSVASAVYALHYG